MARPPPCENYGDVTGNGYVTSADDLMIADYIVGSISFTPDQFVRADVNGDGEVTTVDRLLIQQYIAGTIDTFPVCATEHAVSFRIPNGATLKVDEVEII